MGARDLINVACAKANAWRDRTYATAVLDELSAAGYVILSPDEVRGIRDEALEEAFVALDLADRLIESAYGTDTPREWDKAFRSVAKARSLKGGRDAQ